MIKVRITPHSLENVELNLESYMFISYFSTYIQYTSLMDK